MIDVIHAGHSIFLIPNIKIDYIVITVPGYMYAQFFRKFSYLW